MTGPVCLSILNPGSLSFSRVCNFAGLDAPAILRALDQELREAGATRGSRARGDELKSTILMTDATRRWAEAAEGFDPYIHDTCDVMSFATPTKVLGGWLENSEIVSDKLKELARKTNVLMETIEQVEIPIVGFVLKATCQTSARPHMHLGLQAMSSGRRGSSPLTKVSRQP